MLLSLFILFGLFSPASAATHVKGYTKSNGTHVTSHMRSNSNSSKKDNYSTKGNVNPYTGAVGTKPAYK
ncbi:MAG: hypothetical protein NTW78_02265 [Campylobacterales bacterium]|nr:hypothetical protein [Campylobacterales bacterium]